MQLLSLVQNNSSFKQTALDPGKGSRRPPPALLLDQTEDRRAEKIWGRNPPPYLRVWMTAPPPPASPLSHGLGPALANENFVRTANVDLASFLHFVVDTVN